MRTKYRCLIVGAGSAGLRHFRNLKKLGVSDFVFFRTGLGTLKSKELTRYASEKSLTRALRHKPNIAIIANPTSLHLETALACAEQSCDLFIEKPISDSLVGLDRLRRIVKRNSLITQIGCQFRFHPLLNSMKNSLKRGKIGTVIGVSAEWSEFLPSWHPWENYKKSYSAQKKLGGGVVLT